MNERKKRKSFWEKLALKKINQPGLPLHDNDELFLLSAAEIEKLKKIRTLTYIKVGGVGALGVILLYLPYHLFGSKLFPYYNVWIPIYGDYIELEVSFLIYSAVLVILEIWYLTYTNIKAVAAISKVCGHPDPNRDVYQTHIDALIAVSVEKQQKQLQSLGINPYQGLSGVSLFLFQSLIKLKAALSNFLFTLLVKKLMGRYALRQIVDFAGIPIYAFWNIWGAKKVMDEAKIRVIALPLINRCAELIHAEQEDNQQFITHLFDTLQLVSETKRAFHFNHYLFSSILFKKFDIEIKEKPEYNNNFINEISALSAQTKDAVEKVFIFGIMVDGRISYIEKKVLRSLIANKVINRREEDILAWSKSYFQGKGMPDFFSLFTQEYSENTSH